MYSTGMLVMLLQSILKVSDMDIVADYFKSNQMRKGSAALDRMERRRGRLDRNIFSGSSREAMETTLEFLRGKYGSISDYLNAIGFDESWRIRLLKVLKHPNSRL
jgi:hypothetical protein